MLLWGREGMSGMVEGGGGIKNWDWRWVGGVQQQTALILTLAAVVPSAPCLLLECWCGQVSKSRSW